jgi:hypothetical protein
LNFPSLLTILSLFFTIGSFAAEVPFLLEGSGEKAFSICEVERYEGTADFPSAEVTLLNDCLRLDSAILEICRSLFLLWSAF